MDSRRGPPWGKLVKVDSSETVLLFSRECIVGRKKGCHLCFPANKLVSGEHCKIVKDESSGLVWLEDMSTNGTMINMSKMVKKQTHVLQNGDVIYFVYRKSEPEQNIAYVYHSIKMEQTASQHNYVMERSAHSPSRLPGSEMSLSVEPVMLSKAPKDTTQEEPQPSTSASHFCIETSYPSGAMAAITSPASDQDKNPTTAQEKETENLEPKNKRRKTDNEKSYDLGVPHTSSPEAVSPNKASLSSKPPVEGTKTDKMEESLTCVICQDLLHDCVSLQPCMHVFCAACYSGWMERSSLCPTCRCPVERIHKNHVLNNLVEAYLIQHPAPQEYRCPPQGCHLICTCCFQPMPDRRAELSNQQVIAQQCMLCQQPFCHMYWGCQRIGCQGCLARFSDLNLTDKCLDGVLNNNNYESEVLQSYLSSRGKSWKDLLMESLQGLQQGKYLLTDCRISANTILCFCCGLRAFKELAYKYRQNIAPSELPAAVTSRPDCYWGRNCRTQVKAHHAAKFNHICEQTRFKS